MSFPAYPGYKDSGVEWLGAVPDDWVVRKVSVDFSATKGPRGALLTKEYCHENSGEYPVYSGQTENGGVLGEIADFDFDLGRDGAILSTTVGAKAMSVSHVTGRVSLSQNCMIIKSINRDISTKFFFYHFQPLFLLERKMIPDHMQPSFRMEDLYSFRIAVPPEIEQTQIARFLDHETARIDALIEEQQRLIELLKEKRQAVISHAVTKGLDPTVPMKDSGIEWLGEVPAHWEVTKFKWPLRTASGGTPPSNDRATYYDGGIPWLRSLDLTDDLVSEYEVTVTQRAIEETSCKMVPQNSVLIAMYGGDGTIGKNGLLTFDSAINQAICAFLPSDRCKPEYLHRYIQFYRPYWMIGAESSRKDANIGQDRIGDHFLMLPPLSEQVGIVDFTNGELLKFSGLVKEAELGVALLQERRSALISAAVTGKIDVRGWQPPASVPAPELAQEAV